MYVCTFVHDAKLIITRAEDELPRTFYNEVSTFISNYKG